MKDVELVHFFNPTLSDYTTQPKSVTQDEIKECESLRIKEVGLFKNRYWRNDD